MAPGAVASAVCGGARAARERWRRRPRVRALRGVAAARLESGVEEADGDDPDEQADERLEVAHAQPVHQQEGDCVDAREQAARPQRPPEEQLERDRRAHHLLDVAARHRQLHHEVDAERDPPRVAVAHALGQVAAGDEAQPRAALLQNEADHGAPPEHPYLRRPRRRALLQIRLEVARVEVGEAHQPARPCEAPQLSPAEAEDERRRPGSLAVVVDAVRVVGANGCRGRPMGGQAGARLPGLPGGVSSRVPGQQAL